MSRGLVTKTDPKWRERLNNTLLTLEHFKYRKLTLGHPHFTSLKSQFAMY